MSDEFDDAFQNARSALHTLATDDEGITIAEAEDILALFLALDARIDSLERELRARTGAGVLR